MRYQRDARPANGWPHFSGKAASAGEALVGVSVAGQEILGRRQSLPVAASELISAENMAGIAAGVTTGMALTAAGGKFAVGIASEGAAAAIASFAGAEAAAYMAKWLFDAISH